MQTCPPPLQGRGRGWGLSPLATLSQVDRPHPNPSPEGEGLQSRDHRIGVRRIPGKKRAGQLPDRPLKFWERMPERHGSNG